MYIGQLMGGMYAVKHLFAQNFEEKGEEQNIVAEDIS
jgi:hypothetical protein